MNSGKENARRNEERAMSDQEKNDKSRIEIPSAEAIQRELANVKSIDDFFGRDGVMARLFSKTLEQMLEAELTAQLGYEKYEAKGRKSGNSRNGHYTRKLRTSQGQSSIAVP